MRKERNIFTVGLLIMFIGLVLLSPLLEGYKANISEYGDAANKDYSSQYCFSSISTSLNGNYATLSGGSNSLQVNLTNGPSFASCFLEKILSYSYLREKYLSKASTKPFPQYIIHQSGTQNDYFVYVLREIII